LATQSEMLRSLCDHADRGYRLARDTTDRDVAAKRKAVGTGADREIAALGANMSGKRSSLVDRCVQ
jgi:hypothetical protein